MPQDWKSYDAIAASHARIVASIFERPARDLVAIAGVPVAARVLDVGSGTGIVGLAAAKLGGDGARVVAIDPSIEMLRTARRNGLLRAVQCGAPGLSFSNAAFDRVFASFVLSHLPLRDAAMRDMVRVLRPGGKLGATSWGNRPSEVRKHWQNLADSVVGKEALQAAVREALPGEEWFENAENMRRTFEDAGLARVELHYREYQIRQPVTEFLAGRENALQGQFLRRTVDATAWEGFRRTCAEQFRDAYGDVVEFVRDVHIAIGMKS
jgi:ubiquinone/menaquinone biosynthesis C-methylase UbiE